MLLLESHTLVYENVKVREMRGFILVVFLSIGLLAQTLIVLSSPGLCKNINGTAIPALEIWSRYGIVPAECGSIIQWNTLSISLISIIFAPLAQFYTLAEKTVNGPAHLLICCAYVLWMSAVSYMRVPAAVYLSVVTTAVTSVILAIIF